MQRVFGARVGVPHSNSTKTYGICTPNLKSLSFKTRSLCVVREIVGMGSLALI